MSGTLYLAHHGILGQKWGVRRFQNPDGTLTPAGRKRYERDFKKKVSAFEKNGSKNKYYDVQADFEKAVLNDKKYLDLSKKAHEAERKRAQMETEAYLRSVDEDDEGYFEKLYDTKEYRDAIDESMKATKERNERARELEEQWVSRFQDAYLDDLDITEHRDIAKTLLQNVGLEIVDVNLDSTYDDFDEDIGSRDWSVEDIWFWDK